MLLVTYCSVAMALFCTLHECSRALCCTPVLIIYNLCYAVFRMSSATSVPSINPSSSLKWNSSDIGWDYGVLVDPNNLNVIKCKFCDLVVRAGIYRLKQHVGGIRGEVRPCLKAPPEAIDKCKKAVDDSKQAKKSRQEEKQDVRDVVILDDGPDVEDTTINGEELDDVGDSTQCKLGPMDKFTLPMDSSSLSNTKLVRQQRITEALWKERMHALKRYIARWVYVHGNKLVHCSITEINVVNFWSPNLAELFVSNV